MFPNSKDTTDLATPVAGESQHETVTRIVEDMLKHRSAEEIARDPIFVQLYASSALATMDYSSWEKALQVFEKAVTESLASTDSFVLPHLLAEARLRTGRTAGALAAAERALELFPNEGTTVRQYVIAAVAEGRREDAERVLGAAIEAGPQDSPDALRTLKDLKRRLKAGVYENLSTAELVTRLADSVSMPNDEDVLFGGVTTLYDIALRRELLRAIVSDPKKHAKNLRILKATEPVLTEEGVFACRSSLQEEGFPIEFNLPYAGISMIAPEALRSFARGVLMGDFGRVEKLRVDDPFEAKVFSEGGKTETVSLLSYFGSSCAESRLTGDEVVYRPMTIEDERILASKEFRPADSDREAWLALIADWVAAGAYAPLARIDDLGESQYNDFAVELARANLVVESDTGLRVLKRKKAIGLLEQALDEADEEALDDEERFRILQVLGMAYYTDERHWDAVQTFKRALKIRIDSTVLVSLGYALAANSTGILDEPFDVRTARTWMLLTKSARTLRRHIRSAYASGRNARDAVVPAMTGLCGDWVHRAGFESKSERMGYVILSGNCDMAQIFAELAFVEHKPAIAANDWKFEVGMREDLRIDERLQEWIEPLGLKSIRIDPKPAGDMIALTVYLESDDPRPRCYHEAVARQVVAEAIGEAPFMYFCMQEIRFRHEPALDRGMTPSAFAHYFYDMFPQA